MSPPKATAAGKGSAASLEFLEDAYKRARGETGDAKSTAEGDQSRSADAKGDGANSRPTKSDTVEGGRDGGAGGNADDGADGKDIVDRERNASVVSEGGADIEEGEPPDGRGKGGGVDGFAVIGEGETVALALRALSKVLVDMVLALRCACFEVGHMPNSRVLLRRTWCWHCLARVLKSALWQTVVFCFYVGMVLTLPCACFEVSSVANDQVLLRLKKPTPSLSLTSHVNALLSSFFCSRQRRCLHLSPPCLRRPRVTCDVSVACFTIVVP